MVVTSEPRTTQRPSTVCDQPAYVSSSARFIMPGLSSIMPPPLTIARLR